MYRKSIIFIFFGRGGISSAVADALVDSIAGVSFIFCLSNSSKACSIHEYYILKQWDDIVILTLDETDVTPQRFSSTKLGQSVAMNRSSLSLNSSQMIELRDNDHLRYGSVPMKTQSGNRFSICQECDKCIIG